MDHRALILKQLLTLVPFDGWSDYALREAAKRAGLAESDARAAFPNGAGECLEYFYEQADERLENGYPGNSLASMRVPERIETLLSARLESWTAQRETVRRAIAAGCLPWNAGIAANALLRTVDLIWRLAGDNATDFSYYTKRATLAGIYSSVLMFWLNDESEHFEETRAFLKRRLSDVAAFGKWKRTWRERLVRWS